MKCTTAFATFLVIVGGATVTLPASEHRPSNAAPPAPLPLVFEPNVGQLDPDVSFTARGRGYRLWLTGRDATLALAAKDGRADVVRMRLEGDAGPQLHADGETLLPTRVNYFVGNDPSRWRTNVRAFERVRVHDVYRGIDAVYYGHDGRLEYDFVVAPGADAGAIAFSFEGVDGIDLRDGDLAVRTVAGDVTLRRPLVYQDVDGDRRTIDARYVVDDRRVTLALGEYDASRALVIDPAFDYATILGGPFLDSATAVAVDANGNAYVAGATHSPTWTPSPGGTLLNQSQLSGPAASPNHTMPYVAKIDPTGSTVEYLTYVSGSGAADAPTSIAVDALGQAYVGMALYSNDFPNVNGYQSPNGNGSGALFKLDATGGTLLYSTAINGSVFNGATVSGIAVNNSGIAWVTGTASGGTTDHTFVNGFLTTVGAFMTTGDGAFVAKINTNASGLGSLVFSTLYHQPVQGANSGGSNGVKIAVDAAGNSYIMGSTTELQLPVPNGFQTVNHQGGASDDAYMAKFNATGSQVLYATYIGGTGVETAYLTSDIAWPPSVTTGGIAADDNGHVWVAGATDSSDFPTTPGAIKSGPTGSQDGFVVKIDTNLSGPASEIYGTLIGAYGNEWISGIAVTPSDGNVYITGSTESVNPTFVAFPTTACAVQPTSLGTRDAYLMRLNSTGTAIVYSTFIGGSGYDDGHGLAVDASGHAYVVGITDDYQNHFPTTPGAFQTTGQGSGADGFLVKIDTGTCAADLQVVKQADHPTAPVGGQIVYTITVTNNGSITATNVTLKDSLPVGAALVSAVSTPSDAQDSCNNVGNDVTCTYASVAPGASVLATITVTADGTNLGQATSGPLSNTATVTADQIDPNPSDNSSTAVVNVSRGTADVSITKGAASTDTIGTPLVYTIVVSNSGPDTAYNVSVTDALPSIVGSPQVVISDPSALCSGSTIITCSIPSVAPGSPVTITVTVTPNATGTAHNVATVTSDTYDPNVSNNSAFADTTINPTADVSITNSAPATVNTGSTITYSIVVKNNGPSTATNVVVVDALPANTFVTAPVPGCNGTVFGPLTCTIGSLASGASAPLSITVMTAQPDPAATDTASVSANEFDPNMANNTASAVTAVSSVVDMGVTNNGAPGTITVGANITYTLTTTNFGPSPAKNIVVTDVIPAGMPVVSATINSTSLPCGVAPGPSNTTVVTCNIGDKAANAGDSMTIVATGNVVGTMNATATVTANGTDPNPANNTATAVNVVKAKSADLWIAIQPTTFAPLYNTSFGYTFTVKNQGPDPATGVAITDVLPASLAFVSSATGCAPVTPGSQTIQCAIGPLAVNGTASRSITVTANAVGAISDTASVAGVEGDPVPANNSATAIVNVPASADLSIILTAAPNPVIVQNNFTYKMTTTNNGPSTATTVVSVLHLLPSTGHFQAVGVLPANCVGVGGTKPHINCTYASLGSGQSVSTNFTFKATGIGTVSTSATTSSAVADPNQANNTATHNEIIKSFIILPILQVLQNEIRVGGVKQRAAGRLTETLTRANDLAERGHYRAAREILLNEFTDQVNRFMADGSVTQAAGAMLLQEVNIALGIEVLR